MELTGEKKQEILGFGGCFNELGWDALKKVDEKVREDFIRELYGEEGCKFNMGRKNLSEQMTSARVWYSCDETDGDYELKRILILTEIKNTRSHLSKSTGILSPIWNYLHHHGVRQPG